MKTIRKMYKLVIGILLIGAPLMAAEPSKQFQKKPRMIPVEEIDGEYFPKSISGFMKDFAGEEIPREPLVFRGAAKNWPSKKWTPEWLAENYGDEEVNPVLNWADSQLEDDRDNMLKVNQYYTLADHIKDIRNNEKYAGYLLSASNFELLESWQNRTQADDGGSICLIRGEDDDKTSDLFLARNQKLLNDFSFPKLDIEDDKSGYIAFIGPKNTRTKFHNHGPVFLSQVYGKKKVYLISPDRAKYLCCIDNNESDCESNIDPEDPDLEACPSFANVQIQEAVLNAGDVLYLPPYWYHYVVAEDTSISMSMFLKYPGEEEIEEEIEDSGVLSSVTLEDISELTSIAKLLQTSEYISEYTSISKSLEYNVRKYKRIYNELTNSRGTARASEGYISSSLLLELFHNVVTDYEAIRKKANSQTVSMLKKAVKILYPYMISLHQVNSNYLSEAEMIVKDTI